MCDVVVVQPFLTDPTGSRHCSSSFLDTTETIDVSFGDVPPIPQCVHELVVAQAVLHLSSSGSRLRSERHEQTVEWDGVVAAIDNVAGGHQQVVSSNPGWWCGCRGGRDERCHGEDVEGVLIVAVEVGDGYGST